MDLANYCVERRARRGSLGARRGGGHRALEVLGAPPRRPLPSRWRLRPWSPSDGAQGAGQPHLGRARGRDRGLAQAPGRRRPRRRAPGPSPGTCATRGPRCPALSTIHRILRRRGFVIPQPQKRPRSSWTRFESDLPNETWQSDMTHWHLDDDAARRDRQLHRRLLARGAGQRGRARRHRPDVVADLLRDRSHLRASRPRCSRTTARSTPRAYRGSHTGMEIELAALGITFKHGKPYHPQTQGKVERYHLTLKKWLRKKPRRRPSGRAPSPDRPLRPHLQRGASPHRAGLSPMAGVASARQGHHRARRPAAVGPHQGPPRPRSTRPDASRCATARGSTTSASAASTSGKRVLDPHGRPRRPGDRRRRQRCSGTSSSIPRSTTSGGRRDYRLRVHVSQKI